jgi:hypothetical protein
MTNRLPHFDAANATEAQNTVLRSILSGLAT